jgi:hypothetical protein
MEGEGLFNMRRQISSEELHTLYSLIGEGIWHLQNVEEILDVYITLKGNVKKRGSMPEEKAEKILAKHRRNTLGSSIKAATKLHVLSEKLQEQLKLFKKERDWLVHRSVYQHRADLYDDEKRSSLFTRIGTFNEEAIMIIKILATELEEFVVSQGVDRNLIQQEGEKRTRELMGE